MRTAGVQRNAPTKRSRNGRFYPMRGRCVCDLCHHRMQGSCQKGAHYMRCLWASGRGAAGAKATGHPGSLQIKEQVIVEEALDFLARRVFAPDALARLSDELTAPVTSPADDPAAKLSALEARLAEVETAIDRQVRVFEKHVDPNHPVVVGAERRIENLSGQREQLEAERERLASQPSPGPSIDLAAVLASLPDLRPTLERYSDEELADRFDALDLEARIQPP